MTKAKDGAGKRGSASKKRTGAATKLVSFEHFAPAARVVALVGDFNQWDSSKHPMKLGAGGQWQVAVRLKPGTYQYKFVVDGDRWEEDAANPNKVVNEHGTSNSLCEVP
jgi:1,4-alpha-glucan branching enzyme